jgi:hypothetical protein
MFLFVSYVDFRSRANTAMLLDLGHHAKGRAHTGGMGRKPIAPEELIQKP